MSGFPSTPVGSVRELLDKVQQDTSDWNCVGHVRPWFRGQADAGEPPLPSVLRTRTVNGETLGYDEFHMITMFRLKAPAFGPTPETSRLDKWLFLMQHHGLPTRLLDWTESPLVACFFAVEAALDRPKPKYCDAANMALWVIHPIELNRITDSRLDDFPNTWVAGRWALENIKKAFGTALELKHKGHRYVPSEYPLAIQPSTVASRVAVQRSCFTVHGENNADFEALLRNTPLVKKGFFRKYVIPRSRARAIMSELEQLGVSYSNVYPDFDGLGKELKRRFWLKQ